MSWLFVKRKVSVGVYFPSDDSCRTQFVGHSVLYADFYMCLSLFSLFAIV